MECKSVNVAATGLVVTGQGRLYGIIVNSHSSGTLKLWDNVLAGQEFIMNTFTFPAGSGVYMFPTPMTFNVGLFATVGGTLNVQLLL